MNDLHCRCLPLWACQIFAHRDILKSMEYNMKVAFCFYHWYFRKMSINVFTTLGLFLFMLRTFWQMSLFLSLHVIRPYPHNYIYIMKVMKYNGFEVISRDINKHLAIHIVEFVFAEYSY